MVYSITNPTSFYEIKIFRDNCYPAIYHTDRLFQKKRNKFVTLYLQFDNQDNITSETYSRY